MSQRIKKFEDDYISNEITPSSMYSKSIKRELEKDEKGEYTTIKWPKTGLAGYTPIDAYHLHTAGDNPEEINQISKQIQKQRQHITNLPEIRKFTQFLLQSEIMNQINFSEILIKKCFIEVLFNRINPFLNWPQKEPRPNNGWMDDFLDEDDLRIVRSDEAINEAANRPQFGSSILLKPSQLVPSPSGSQPSKLPLGNIFPHVYANQLKDHPSATAMFDTRFAKHPTATTERRDSVKRAAGMTLQLILEQLKMLQKNDLCQHPKKRVLCPRKLNLLGMAHVAGIPMSVIHRTMARMKPLKEAIEESKMNSNLDQVVKQEYNMTSDDDNSKSGFNTPSNDDTFDELTQFDEDFKPVID